VNALTRGAAGLLAGLLVIAAGAGSALAGPFSDNSDLTAISGQGAGHLTITSTAKPGELRTINIIASVHQAGSNVTFSVQRGLDTTSDGTCDSLAPYEELGTLTTSEGGGGAVQIERLSPSPSGDTFDVQFQLVGDDGSVLVTECMTVTLQ